ncbi:hypothetical protein VTI28DRAFT_3866 [Corynascus sepedonium]
MEDDSSSSDKVQVLPQDNAEEAQTTMVPQSRDPQSYQYQYQYNDQHQPHARHPYQAPQATDVPKPPLALPTEIPLGEIGGALLSRRNGERLARKRSTQRLRLSRPKSGQLRKHVTPTATQTRASGASSVETPGLRTSKDWATRDANTQLQPPQHPGTSQIHAPPPPPPWDEPIEVDEAYIEPERASTGPDPTQLLDQPTQVDEAYLKPTKADHKLNLTQLLDEPIEVDEACLEPEKANHRPNPTQLLDQPIEVDEADQQSEKAVRQTNPTQLLESLVQADEAQEEAVKPEDKRLTDVKRLRRRTSSLLRPSSRPLDPRLEDMITTGTQCNVRSEPRPAPTPSLATSGLVRADLDFIEPDPECAPPSPDSDNDTGDMADFHNELRVLAESSNIPMRYTGGPEGVRKYTVGGVALRYRLSADAALRSANVVRSRPRMRKRSRTQHGSVNSSTVSSPAMSSAASPQLPPTQPPP